ncbi:hypothetical protein [Streptomyces sp. NPDC057623]|uniref:hypothetical protein n=1 Tax=Streptomyces sp. NPDC057623 TaxID=3346187 RepID=UPI00369DDFCB
MSEHPTPVEDSDDKALERVIAVQGPRVGLDVPVTALFRGMDDEREAVFVRAGHGVRIVRRAPRPATRTPNSAPCEAPTSAWTPSWSR